LLICCPGFGEYYNLSIIDNDIPFYRVSTSSRSSNKEEVLLCVVTNMRDITSPEKIIDYLLNMNLIKSDKGVALFKEFKKVPIESTSFSNMRKFALIKKEILSRGLTNNINSLNIYGRNAFNDHLIDAFYYFDRERH